MQKLEKLKFLKESQIRNLAEKYKTPTYVYSKSMLLKAVNEVKSAFSKMPFGLTIRYAMKANPYPEVLKFFDKHGLHIDASSEYEAHAALSSGINPKKILITSQQPPQNIKTLLKKGYLFTATSLHQLEVYGKAFPNTKVSIRLNTGLGSGTNHRLTTGGIEVGFGIWFHKNDDESKKINKILEKYNLTVERVHIHIGTGSDPKIWEKLMDAGIYALKKFPKATILNLGGGFKLGYMNGEKGANLKLIGNVARKKIKEFYKKTGRKIKFEIEPGRYLTARAGSIISTIIDKTDTGKHGDVFLRLNTGMTEIVRTAMYGSRHPLIVVPKKPSKTSKTYRYVVIGHCCESSDLLTPTANDPEKIEPRLLQNAEIDDFMIIEMAGAYCASMSVKGYNSFPIAKEVIIK